MLSFDVMLGHFVQAGPIRTVCLFPLGMISYTNKQTKTKNEMPLNAHFRF